MDAVLKNAQPESDAKSSDANNRFQLRLAASARGSALGSAHVPNRRPLRVLIVDDDRDAADTLATLVKRWGHDTQRAYDGATGLAMALAATPDVVLLDIALPQMDGCELVSQLRHGAGLNDCFLIAITGSTGEGTRWRCQEAGIDLFLIKPVDALVMETLLMLERQRLGLSPAASVVIDAKSKKYRAAPKALRV